MKDLQQFFFCIEGEKNFSGSLTDMVKKGYGKISQKKEKIKKFSILEKLLF